MNVRTILCLAAALTVIPGMAFAQTSGASCQGGKSFPEWLQAFKAEAKAQGISDRTLAAASPDMQFDQDVANKDRGTPAAFTQPFVQFSDRMANNNRLQAGKQRIQANAATFKRIKEQFGVPAGVLTAYWGLETDFGAILGDGNTIRNVTTLAYECRRADLFRQQLHALLKILDRGDLTPENMRGPRAGELGQFQFLPMHYVEFGLDYDGDGHVNLIRSDADALGSAGNYIKSLGWRPDEPWLVEVLVSNSVPWDQADLTIEHPAEQWAAWGVTRADGQPISGPPSSLHLPQGRHGPAFLAYPNFKNVYLTWNHSLIYSTTAAYLATRLEGAPAMSKGDGTPDVDAAGVKELQKLLAGRGYDVGKFDGVVGAGSRAAIKKEQMRLGLPADSYPSAELLEALRAGK